MGVNGVSTNYNTTAANTTAQAAQTEQAEQTQSTAAAETPAATYEKSSSAKSKDNASIVEQLKADAESRHSQLRSLVEKLMVGQGITSNNANGKSTDMYALLRSGKLTVDEKTRTQAQNDIGEDGYWGVEQTSDRLVTFAKALAGDDASKIDTLTDAIKKGFGQATKAWGGKLPDICQKTLDATLKKMDDWKSGK